MIFLATVTHDPHDMTSWRHC